MARMPTTLGERAVPRATRRVASLDMSAGLGLTRRGAAAVGGGLDDVSRGLQVASDALFEEQLKDEERAVKNLEVEWSKKRREILFGDGTPNKPGFFSTAGEDTLNGRKGVEDELNKARSQLLGKASAGRVKQAFDLSSSSALQGELEQVDRYTIAQRKEANVNAANARIDEARQQASTYFSDDGKWNAAVDVIASEFAAIGDERGWSQEVINNETQKVISQTARERINRALITDAKSGAELYAKTKGMIDGDLRIEIEQDIKQAQNAERIQREHSAAMDRLAKQEAADASTRKYVTAFINKEGVDLKAIANDPTMDTQGILLMQRLLEADAEAEGVPSSVSQNTTAEMFRRMHLPQGHPEKITTVTPFQQAFASRQLRRGDLDWLVTEFNRDTTPEGTRLNTQMASFLDKMKSSITKTAMGLPNDALGDRKYYEYTQYVNDQVAAEREAGRDPSELFRPGSKNYLGSKSALAPFTTTLQENIQSKVEALQSESVKSVVDYKTKDEVVEAFRANKLTRDEASKILIDKGWAKP